MEYNKTTCMAQLRALCRTVSASPDCSCGIDGSCDDCPITKCLELIQNVGEESEG